SVAQRPRSRGGKQPRNSRSASSADEAVLREFLKAQRPRPAAANSQGTRDRLLPRTRPFCAVSSKACIGGGVWLHMKPMSSPRLLVCLLGIVLAGCQRSSVQIPRVRTPGLPLALADREKVEREKEERRPGFDKPSEAFAFYLKKRLPAGATSLPIDRYQSA